MLIRQVLEELASIRGYKNLKKMLPPQDYISILEFTNELRVTSSYAIMKHFRILKRIANYFDVTTAFVIRICELERVQDGRIGK